MDSLALMDISQLRDLMCRCWMTHDAMWFLHSIKEVGIEKTNKINKAACRDMAMIEVKRLLAAIGEADTSIERFDQLQIIFRKMFSIINANFMENTIESLKHNTLRFTWNRCFAYEGVAKMGVIDAYECGIFDRIEGWFDGMRLQYEVSPKITGCMMHTQGGCYRDYTFSLD